MANVDRTPLEIVRCGNALVDEIVHLEKRLLEDMLGPRKWGKISISLPNGISDGNKVSAVCPNGMSAEDYRRTLAEVFLAAAKALEKQQAK